MISKEKLIYISSTPSDGDAVASFLHASGGALTSTTVGSDEALDVNIVQSVTLTVQATDFDIRDLSHTQDSIRIGDGTDFLAVNPDGSINVNANVSIDAMYQEDAPHTSADEGLYTLSVRQDVYASSTSADGDYQSFKSDNFGRLWVNDSAQSAMANGAATVTTTSALLVAANSGRREILIQNLGNKAIFVGASGVSAANGIRIAAGGNVALRIGDNIALHAVAESGSQDVRYLQLA